MDEIVVDPATGGRKGTKVERFDLIPPGPLRAVAAHFGRGATKYDDRNWEKGYSWSLSYAAMMRHLTAFWGGEDYDPEFPESHHLDAAMFHCMALREFGMAGTGTDDRPASMKAYTDAQARLKRASDRVEYADARSRMAAEFYETYRTKENSDGATVETSGGEQATPEGRVSTVQANRWEVP